MPLGKDIFLQNKYTNVYINLIARGIIRSKPIGYAERHHIVPRSLGGSNDEENLVWLTPREHFICHRLLTRMTSGRAKSTMCYALLIMLSPSEKAHGRKMIYAGKSRAYDTLRRLLANECSIAMSKRWAAGEMTSRSWTPEQKAVMSEFQQGHWQTMTDEQRALRVDHNQRNGSAAYVNLSDDEREAHNQASSEGSRKFWDQVTPEQLAEMNAKNMESKRANGTDLSAIQTAAYANMPAETKHSRAEKIREAKKAYWADPENRRKQQERQAAIWAKRKAS